MKRDLNIFRDVLLQMEAVPAGHVVEKFNVPDGVSEPTFLEHLDLMIKADLIEGQSIRDHNGDVATVVVQKMTNKGYDFLDSIRDNTVWEKTKSKVGSASLDIVKTVAESIFRAGLGL